MLVKIVPAAIQHFRGRVSRFTDRAYQIGLFEKETAEEMKHLYTENRTESYYRGSRPTEEQPDAMTELAIAVHQFAASQIRKGGVCLCP